MVVSAVIVAAEREAVRRWSSVLYCVVAVLLCAEVRGDARATKHRATLEGFDGTRIV